MNVIPVVVVSAVRLYREGLVQLLDQQAELEVVGSASCLAHASLTAERLPLVVLLDLTSVEVHDLTLPEPSPHGTVRVVALGIPETDEDVIACAEAGIAGYVRRDGSLPELVHTIRSAVCGEFPCSPRIVGTLVRRLATLANGRPASTQQPMLTLRELQVVELIDRGLTNKEIARKLGIEVSTAKNHVHNLLGKLNVQTRNQAANRMRWSMSQPHQTWVPSSPVARDSHAVDQTRSKPSL